MPRCYFKIANLNMVFYLYGPYGLQVGYSNTFLGGNALGFHAKIQIYFLVNK